MKVAQVVAIALLVNICSSVRAGVNVNAKVAVHVLPHASRTCAKGFPSLASCKDIITAEASPEVDAFPVFYDLAEFQGFEYGLTWPGLETCAFTSCSDLTIGGIIRPGDGISHAWTACQYDAVAITGWGWLHDYGKVCVVGHPKTGGPTIASCQRGTDVPIASFCAGIGDSTGDDPCASYDATRADTAAVHDTTEAVAE